MPGVYGILSDEEKEMLSHETNVNVAMQKLIELRKSKIKEIVPKVADPNAPMSEKEAEVRKTMTRLVEELAARGKED